MTLALLILMTLAFLLGVSVGARLPTHPRRHYR